MSSTSGDTTPLEADFAALRKLRDDDASGVLKKWRRHSRNGPGSAAMKRISAAKILKKRSRGQRLMKLETRPS
jgi:hypothetical protein